MTENKRFKFVDGYSLRYNCIIDNLKGEDKDIYNVLKTDEVLNMLNKLYEENKELKEEDEQLKQQIKDLRINVLDSIHEAEVFVKDIKTLLFVMCFCKLPDTHKLSESEKQSIRRLQDYVGEPILNLKKFNGDDVE